MQEPAAHDLQCQIAGACDEFHREFGLQPTFAAQAPGRVNLIGEHTDYNGGYVLPMAIDRRAVIMALPSQRGVSRLIAHNLRQSATIDFQRQLSPNECPWVNHLLGVVAQFKSIGISIPNLDLVLNSTVPVGAGLSSSAAIEMAMATLLESVMGVDLAPLQKARKCQRAEHEFVGTPCGIMDLYIAECAQAGHALLIDCQAGTHRAVLLPRPNVAEVIVVDTGVSRTLARGVYAARRAECQAAANALGLGSLRGASMNLLRAAKLPECLQRRALHVIEENHRTLRAAEALNRGDLAEFGLCMYESHESLKTQFEVTCPELDCVVDACRSLGPSAIHGARMTGAGLGGCAIALTVPGRTPLVIEQIRKQFHARFGRAPSIFIAHAAGPAGPCSITSTDDHSSSGERS